MGCNNDASVGTGEISYPKICLGAWAWAMMEHLEMN